MKGFPYWDFTRRCNTVIIIIDTVGMGLWDDVSGNILDSRRKTPIDTQ